MASKRRTFATVTRSLRGRARTPRGDVSDLKTVSVTDAELQRLALVDGDLLFVRTNGNPENVGRCAVFTRRSVEDLESETRRWIYASYLIRARLSVEFEPAYVAAYLGSARGRKYLRDRSKTSAGQYNINIDGLGNVPIPVADRRAQQEFAARAARLGQQREVVLRACAQADELFASLQSRAFRGEL